MRLIRAVRQLTAAAFTLDRPDESLRYWTAVICRYGFLVNDYMQRPVDNSISVQDFTSSVQLDLLTHSGNI